MTEKSNSNACDEDAIVKSRKQRDTQKGTVLEFGLWLRGPTLWRVHGLAQKVALKFYWFQQCLWIPHLAHQEFLPKCDQWLWSLGHTYLGMLAFFNESWPPFLRSLLTNVRTNLTNLTIEKAHFCTTMVTIHCDGQTQIHCIRTSTAIRAQITVFGKVLVSPWLIKSQFCGRRYRFPNEVRGNFTSLVSIIFSWSYRSSRQLQAKTWNSFSSSMRTNAFGRDVVIWPRSPFPSGWR